MHAKSPHPVRGRWYKVDERRPVRPHVDNQFYPWTENHWSGVRPGPPRPADPSKFWMAIVAETHGDDPSIFNDETILPEGFDPYEVTP
ncbi:hypothetical protein UFOVP1382_13 [uncultured Caudovirales phage]|uniref:Uncharacterized protein n=1 Tax=uncultured Caudovirales phage TaxID=2100421 RepID=A0A6J5S4E0_9CAUD|nr:hypothetical protein UFOVP1382_13 [uncultured Caudovirales phage]